MRIYLDYAATSPVKPEVKKAILPYLENEFGNPSSIHQWGRAARAAVDEARENVAKFLNAKPNEIIFTSGGTEADNLAIRGVINESLASTFKVPTSISPARKSGLSAQLASDHAARLRDLLWKAHGSQLMGFIPHIITTQIEHHAILKTCEDLEKGGMAEVTYLKPNKEGLILVEQVKKAIKNNTVLVSIMYVNNEVGTVQSIREIGKMIEAENRNKKNLIRIYFHTDAVQASEYQKMDVDYLHVDLLTISGHKIGAPKGIGALYIRKNTPMKKILFGGEQEMNLRSGTENVAGIVALGKAVEVLRNEKLEIKVNKVQKLRDYFISKILKEIPEVELNGSHEERSPSNANFYFKYIEGESILLNLDLVGIAASSGSACTSLSLSPSHVLMAVYGHPERAHGSIRFTLGEKTTKEEIDYTIKNLIIIVKKLRKISPFWKEK